MSDDILTQVQRTMLRILMDCADRALSFYPAHDGFVPTPGLQREIICDVMLDPLVRLRLVEKKRISRPTCLMTFATHAWRLTKAGRLAAQGGANV